jgi:hypothetical protein
MKTSECRVALSNLSARMPGSLSWICSSSEQAPRSCRHQTVSFTLHNICIDFSFHLIYISERVAQASLPIPVPTGNGTVRRSAIPVLAKPFAVTSVTAHGGRTAIELPYFPEWFNPRSLHVFLARWLFHGGVIIKATKVESPSV